MTSPPANVSDDIRPLAGQRACVVTGAGGYLGSCVVRALTSRGWRVMKASRAPLPDGIPFRLGEPIEAQKLNDARALVHCAYDFKQYSWNDISRINIQGTRLLLQAARKAGIRRVLCVSSISAFEGCRSLYGRAKLEIEAVARDQGAAIIRPGLIWGELAGGMFGRLVAQVETARALPLLGGGTQLQYLAHEQDLCSHVADWAAGTLSLPPDAVTLAHEQAWTFRAILEEIARARAKRLSFLPLPWRLVWLALKFAEGMHRPLDFRSDSLLSLIYQNPNPSFAAQRELGLSFRPFRLGPTAAVSTK